MFRKWTLRIKVLHLWWATQKTHNTLSHHNTLTNLPENHAVSFCQKWNRLRSWERRLLTVSPASCSIGPSLCLCVACWDVWFGVWEGVREQAFSSVLIWWFAAAFSLTHCYISVCFSDFSFLPCPFFGKKSILIRFTLQMFVLSWETAETVSSSRMSEAAVV